MPKQSTREHNYPAFEWPREEVKPWAPVRVRPPTVPARDADPGEIPSAVASLRSAIEMLGWDTRVTYAEGFEPGEVEVPVTSVALRCRRGHRYAVAVWNLGTSPTGRASVKASSAFLDRKVVGATVWKSTMLADPDDETWAALVSWIDPAV